VQKPARSAEISTSHGGGVTFYVHPLCCASDAGLKKLDRATSCEYESLTVVVTILGNSKQR